MCQSGVALRLPPHSLILLAIIWSGAGDGNRTRVASLEDWNSTIELRPQLSVIVADAEALSIRRVFAAPVQKRGKDLAFQGVQ